MMITILDEIYHHQKIPHGPVNYCCQIPGSEPMPEGMEYWMISTVDAKWNKAIVEV
jgi:hypothetical protein